MLAYLLGAVVIRIESWMNVRFPEEEGFKRRGSWSWLFFSATSKPYAGSWVLLSRMPSSTLIPFLWGLGSLIRAPFFHPRLLGSVVVVRVRQCHGRPQCGCHGRSTDLQWCPLGVLHTGCL